jgi:hypothetical protein
LRVAEEARIGGKLTYRSPVEQAGAIAAKPEGGVEFVLSERQASAPTGARAAALAFWKWLVGRARELITLLLLGALALWRLPALCDRLSALVGKKPFPALGWGALVAVVGYGGAFAVGLVVLLAGILMLVLTLGGLSGVVFGLGFSALGLALAAFSFLVSFASKLVVAYLVGVLVAGKLGPRLAESRGWALVIGVVLYVIAAGLPFIGWLVALLATLLGLGAMWLAYRERRVAAPAPVTVA